MNMFFNYILSPGNAMACLQTMKTDNAGVSDATKDNIQPMINKIISSDHFKRKLGVNEVSVIYFDGVFTTNKFMFDGL
ncbi:hypothetical protein DPMN_152517 [Dreissena polymorpha]|uniref:Uncharacterized protein n=1 Tax=Dreissena polymorpha TaxID=45954 RepID=A0A9D4FKJ3_DREPO|nr:hypothetical protein DPMN_152517 [Dreissena polymorpha]